MKKCKLLRTNWARKSRLRCMTYKTRSQTWEKVCSAPRTENIYLRTLTKKSRLYRGPPAMKASTTGRRRFSRLLIHKATSYVIPCSQSMMPQTWTITFEGSKTISCKPPSETKSGWWVLCVYLCLELIAAIRLHNLEFTNNFKSLNSKLSIKLKKKANIFTKNFKERMQMLEPVTRKVR